VITAEGLSWSYGATALFDQVGVQARHGRVLGLIGPNGAGKSTLLRLLYGALTSPHGRVTIDDVDLARLGARETARQIAVVVQESGTDSSLSVAEMVLIGRSPHLGGWGRASAHDEQVAATALAQVGATHLARRPFAALSGGERQRVLIARALAQEATHLLLDEPTNHLDIRFQHEVLGVVASLAHDLGCSVVVVLHDLNLAARYCDDLVLLGQGAVVAAGPASEVLTPEHLEPVYGIGVERVEDGPNLFLHFHPHTPEEPR
jgi:iron complex transport system ATP-binding protein